MKSQIDLELAQMRNMSKKEAAAAAARAVADAEAAIAEAEEAAREAEQAEADAEAAQAFAELAMKTWKARNAQKMVNLLYQIILLRSFIFQWTKYWKVELSLGRTPYANLLT